MTSLAAVSRIFTMNQSAQGFRTLAVSYRFLKTAQTSFSVADEKEMVLSGLITFIDPPKESARELIQSSRIVWHSNVIRTGDNELVARKTCELIGLPVKGVLTGADVEHLNLEALGRVVDGATIFSRMTPSRRTG